jgi:hypothetical protein
VGTYNYERFDSHIIDDRGDDTFRAWTDRNHVGDPARDGLLTRLSDRSQVELSQLWRRQHVVIEFGSFT